MHHHPTQPPWNVGPDLPEGLVGYFFGVERPVNRTGSPQNESHIKNSTGPARRTSQTTSQKTGWEIWTQDSQQHTKPEVKAVDNKQISIVLFIHKW